MSIGKNVDRCSSASINSNHKLLKNNNCTANERDGNNDTLNEHNSCVAENTGSIVAGSNDNSVEKLGKEDNKNLQSDKIKNVLKSTAVGNNITITSAGSNALIKPTNSTNGDISLVVIPAKKRKIEIIEQKFFYRF